MQLAITWYKIRHAGGQAHYCSRTGTLNSCLNMIRSLLQWLCQTILVRLVSQIEAVNEILTRIGCSELQLGSKYRARENFFVSKCSLVFNQRTRRQSNEPIIA